MNAFGKSIRVLERPLATNEVSFRVAGKATKLRKLPKRNPVHPMAV